MKQKLSCDWSARLRPGGRAWQGLAVASPPRIHRGFPRSMYGRSPSGLYLLAQYDAYQKAADLASSDQDAANVKAFLKQTITVDSRQRRDGHRQRLCAPGKRWRTCRPTPPLRLRFDELGGQLTAEEEQQADSYASAADGPVRRYLQGQRHRAGDRAAV